VPFIHTFDVVDYLFNVGKAATEQVAKTAKQFRETVEEKVTDICVYYTAVYVYTFVSVCVLYNSSYANFCTCSRVDMMRCTTVACNLPHFVR